MPKKVDYSNLQKLQKKFTQKANSKTGITTRKVLYEAVKPALERAQQLVPVGKVGKYGYRWGEPGKLKKSLRIRVVKDSPYELKALVGASRKGDNAGWRAHFQEFGPVKGGVHKRRKGATQGKQWTRKWKFTPFAKPAEDQTKDLVTERLRVGVDEQLRREFNTEQ